MTTSQTKAVSYFRSVISTGPLVLDPEVQRLVDGLDYLDTCTQLDSICGVPDQDATFDPFALAIDGESYISLHDLCRGNLNHMDIIRGTDLLSSTMSLATPPTTAIPSLEAHCSALPPPTISSKWVPTSHSGVAPVLLTTPAQSVLVRPIAPRPSRPATLGPVPPASTVGQLQSSNVVSGSRHQPYRNVAPPSNIARCKNKRDYLNAYPANPESITRFQGYRGLIREGRWGPLIVDALLQIRAPYPVKGLQKLLSELYDGEGEQEGVPKGTEGRPANPWRVGRRKICLLRL